MKTHQQLFGTSLLTILWFALAGTAATTSVDAANAPISIIGKKFAFTYQSNDGDSGVAHFFATTASDVWEYDDYDGWWGSDHYQWQASGNSATFKEEELEITLSFSSASGGSFTYIDYVRDEATNWELAIDEQGSGTFVITDFSEDDIPFEQFFSDDFSDQTTTRSNWAKGHNDSKYGLTVKQDQGNYSLTGTFNGDPYDRWINFGAPSLLSLAEDWVIEGGAFNHTVSPSGSSHNSSAKLGIVVEAPGIEFELLIGATPWGSNAHFYFDKDDQYREFHASSAKDGNYRLRHEKSQETIHCEIQEGSDWRTVSSLNWRTGIYSGANGDSVQISQWQSFESMHVQPAMYFVVPHKDEEDNGEVSFYNIGDNQLGFSSFSVEEGAGDDGQDGQDFAPDSLAGKNVRYQETEVDTNGNNTPWGWDEATFSETHRTRWDNDDQAFKSEPYTYEKISDSEARLRIEEDGEIYEADIVFSNDHYATGTWTEVDEVETWSGTLEFEILQDSGTGQDGQDFAPETLVGLKVDEGDTYYIFLTEGTMDEFDVEEDENRPGRAYSYGKTDENTGTMTKPYLDGTDTDVYEFLFTSATGGVITNDANHPFTYGPATNGNEQGGSGIAPDNLIGKKVRMQETEVDANGNKFPYGWEEATFSDTHVTEWDNDDQAFKSEPYTYEKISESEGRIRVEEEGEIYEANITFSDLHHATGTWTEVDEVETWSGTLEFEILGDATEGGDDHNGTEGGFAPEHLDGWTFRFEINAGDGEDVDVVEFRQNEATEKDEDGDSDFEQTTPYSFEKTGPDTAVIRLSGTDGPESPLDVYTLNFVTGETGDGRLDDYAYFETTPSDSTFEATETPGLYKDLIGSGDLTFSVLSRPQGDDNGSGDDHHKPEQEGVPMDQVEGFVGEWMGDKEHYQGAKVMWAEKLHDYVDEDNFVYEVGLDNGVALYFDKNKIFLHSAHDNEFADHEVEELKADEIPQDVKDAIETAHPGTTILEVEKEFSLEHPADGEEKDFIYLAVIEKDGEELEVALGSDGKVHHTHRHEKSDFEEWKPVEFPDAAANHLLGNDYRDGDHEIPYWVEERARPDGTMEFVAYLDDEREVVFDANGTVVSERDPWEERIQKMDAGLKFDAGRSKWDANGTFTLDENSGLDATQGQAMSAFVHIKRVEKDEDAQTGENDFHTHHEEGGMLYRIVLLNRAVAEGNVTSDDFDLGGTDLPADTKLNLTFTYAMEPPSYLVVSGAEVTAFKHRMPEWDRPGSFTIQAKTVDPVASQSNAADSISSTFGILLEMGGERFHGGSVFVTNVIPKDVKGPEFSSSWDPVAGFRHGGLAEANASVTAFLPKRLLQNHFGIWDPNDVKAAIVREDGTLSYIAGSRREEEGDEGDIGGDFARIPFKGYEPEGFDAYDQTEFMLDETMFGLDENGDGLAPEGTYPDPGDDGQDGQDLAPDSLAGKNVRYQETEVDTNGNNTPWGWDEATFSETHRTRWDNDDQANKSEPYTYEKISDSEARLRIEEDGEIYEADIVFSNDHYATGTWTEVDDEETWSGTLEFEIVGNATEGGDDPENPNEEDGEVANSFMDFDGDGFVDSMLKVSFKNDSWPGEVQIGDPWLDPLANVNLDDFGSISGTVSDANGTPLRDFWIWIMKAQDGNASDGTDIYAGEPVFFDLRVNEANGTYVAKVPAGSYYVEAGAHDPETNTPYKPVLAGGRENPFVFEIADAHTSLEQDFNLEAEYRVSHEMGEVKGSIIVSGDESVEGMAIELFPVDANGSDLSDHPVHTLFVEHDGKILGEAPAGTFRAEIVSWDNAYDDVSIPQFTINPEQSLELESIELEKRALVTISGRITNANGTGIWADVLFVDPENPEDQFWPAPNENFEASEEGQYSVSIPAGTYLIKAERFDGVYLPQFYDGDDDGTADTIDINNSITGIDFVLESRPTATVHVQVVDVNTSAPVKYAWFLFHNAEDDQGEIIFSEVHSAGEFNSTDFNGTYEIKVPGGIYKVQVEADGYEPAFRTLDESGAGTWRNTDWEKGAPITLADGDVTTLEQATLKAFEKSEAERFGFAWMDHDENEDPAGGPLPAGKSISGTVKTKDGTDVPKARIIAHTADYLLWLDHVTTRSDGSFELKNLPARDDWVIFAEPPFDSEAFRGFRESNRVELDLMDTNGTADLVLQSSNVYGKILFPKKDHESGETRNAPLAHAHIWAYPDDDGDGEPDFDFYEAEAGDAEPDNDEQETLREAFGETDEKGVFSFYLPKAGQYALQIDLPGHLSALRPAPISFKVRNPDRDLKLGNAIRISWEYRGANSFDIKRKASTESSSTSIFIDSPDDKPTGKATSFVDTSVTPGETYEYQVIATTTKGSYSVPSEDVKASNPIIYLSPPKKTITGYVFDDSNNSVSGAEVVAWREEGEGWSSILTESDGSFELVAGPGKWEVTVYRPYDLKVDWIYEKEPKRIGFKKDASKESKTVNFTVSKATGGKVTGRVVTPAGKTWADVYQYVSVDAFDHEGRGNWTDLDLDSNGSFEIPLQPGNYEVSVWVAPELKGFGSSEVEFVRVGKDSVDVGEFALASRDSKIEGVVKTDDGKLLPNVEVWAWSEEGGWVSDVTNVNGAYSLSVSPGRWEIGFELLPAEDGSAPPYLPEPPKRLRVFDDNEDKTTPTIDFTVREAGKTVEGVVYGPAGKPVTDVDAWAYARKAKANEDDFDEIVADVPVDSRGQFSFPSVPGQYYVGLWLPPGAGYVIPSEQLLTLAQDGTLSDANGTDLTEIAFQLESNDAVVAGAFKLSGSNVTGLSGEVHAAKGDGGGWQSAPIEDNGTYTLTLSPGRWMLGYFIEADDEDRNLPPHPPEPIEVKAKKAQSVTQDFTLRSASATISGTIMDDNGTPITEPVFVWAYREGSSTLDEFWEEVETEANGSFTIPVLPGGEYEVGAFLPDDLRENDFIEPKVTTVDLSSTSPTINLALGKIKEENFIEGVVKDDDGNLLEDAFVYAWSDDGRVIEGETDDTGTYKLKVPKGVVWHVGADYGETDDNGSETIYFAEVELDADLTDAETESGLNLTLKEPDFEVPDGASDSFDPSKDFVVKLPDGTEVTIPGGAANVSSDETSVRAVVTPTAKGLTKTANDQPTSYAYSIELFDSTGKKVEGNFKKDVILKIPVDQNATLAKGLDPDNLEAKFYSTTKNSWDSLKSSTYDSNASVIYATTDHFTNIAPVSNVDTSDLAEGLSKVDATSSGDWYSLNWFGKFYDASSGWVYHETHGWLYPVSSGDGNFWFYDDELGWFWTGSSYYDIANEKYHLYSSGKASWLYFATDESGDRKFYIYDESTSSGSWIKPNGDPYE